MNNLSNATLTEHQKQRHCWSVYSCKPIPRVALLVLAPLFLIGLGVSIFILVVVHNALFFISSFFSLLLLLHFSSGTPETPPFSFTSAPSPDSDLRFARDGDIVKITGLVSCGNVSLESSYEKVAQCIYTSTMLYEYGELGLKPADVNASCFQWRLVYTERFSTDFYVSDMKSGIRALVKAGPDCKVIPLIVESRLVNTTGKCKALSSNLRKWLRDRNLPDEARLLRLEEGYVKEGNFVSVIGRFLRNSDAMMIVQPSELLTTGCLCRKLLLPVDIDGLILGVPKTAGTLTHSNSAQHVDQ